MAADAIVAAAPSGPARLQPSPSAQPGALVGGSGAYYFLIALAAALAFAVAVGLSWAIARAWRGRSLESRLAAMREGARIAPAPAAVLARVQGVTAPEPCSGAAMACGDGASVAPGSFAVVAGGATALAGSGSAGTRVGSLLDHGGSHLLPIGLEHGSGLHLPPIEGHGSFERGGGGLHLPQPGGLPPPTGDYADTEVTAVSLATGEQVPLGDRAGAWEAAVLTARARRRRAGARFSIDHGREDELPGGACGELGPEASEASLSGGGLARLRALAGPDVSFSL